MVFVSDFQTSMTSMITPKALYSKAQGRETHPGLTYAKKLYPEGVSQGLWTMWNPVGVLTLDMRYPRVRNAILGYGVEPRCGTKVQIDRV